MKTVMLTPQKQVRMIWIVEAGIIILTVGRLLSSYPGISFAQNFRINLPLVIVALGGLITALYYEIATKRR